MHCWRECDAVNVLFILRVLQTALAISASTVMKIPVLIERLPNQRFLATGAAWHMSAEGKTSEEALDRLRQQVRERLSRVSLLAYLDTEQLVPSPAKDHPLARFAGCMKDDPLYDEWQTAVAEYRASCDEDGA